MSPTHEVPSEIRDRAWQPRNLQGRFEGRGDVTVSGCERQRDADARRADLRTEMIARIARHHDRVKQVKRMQDRKMSITDRLLAKHSRAEARRTLLQSQKVERVAEHHKRVDHVVESSKRKVPAKKLQQRHRMAEERRAQRMVEQRKLLSERAQRAEKAREARHTRDETKRTKNQAVVTSFRLDSEALDDASFEELQRKLASTQTVSHAKDLLELLSHGFEKVMAEEKQRVGENTPVKPIRSGSVPPSPASNPALSPGSSILGKVASGKVPLNPRIFLSAYICMGDVSEGSTRQPAEVMVLEESVKNHAMSLIDALHGLLKLLEDDSKIEAQTTKESMKSFAREWAAYTSSFEAWRKKDKRALLEHYINVYSEMERGRVDIIAETAVKGTRKPEEHAELMGSIDESLARVRMQIEKLSGEEGTEALGERLQAMYSEHGISPALSASTPPPQASVVSPFPSDLDEPSYTSSDYNTPKKVFSTQPTSPSPALSPQSTPSASSTPSQKVYMPQETRERIQTLVLKAKLANDTIFKLDNVKDGAADGAEDVSDEERVPVTIQRIKAAAEKAFWDLAAEELSATPPNLVRIGGAVEGIKTLLLEVTPRKLEANVKAELADSLDWEVLKKDFTHTRLAAIVNYFVDKVLELEAPAENEATRASSAEILQYITDNQTALNLIVPKALRYLNKKFEDLSHSIHQARKTLIGPLLAQDAEKLVRELYAEEVAAGLHNFEVTKKWLRNALEQMLPLTASKPPRALYKAHPPLSVDDVMRKDNALYTIAPVVAILDSVLYPTDSNMQRDMPETLRLNRDFMRRIADRVQLVTLAAAMSGLAGQVTGNQKVMKPVAEEVVLMLQTPGMRIEGIIEQVAHIVDREHTELIATAKRDLLVSMLRKVANPEEKLYATFLSRLGTLLLQAVVSSPQAALDSLASTPFAHVAPQVGQILTMLTKLTSHNLQWCRPFYDPIMSALSAEFQEAREKVCLGERKMVERERET